MISNAYTLYDAKALTYSPPFYASAHGAAVRMVMDLATDKRTMVGIHPADFTLFCIGKFDDATGRMLPADVREHISDVTALLPNAGAAPSADYFTSASANGRTAEMNLNEPERLP